MKSYFKLRSKYSTIYAVFLMVLLLIAPKTPGQCYMPGLYERQSIFVLCADEGPVFGNYSSSNTWTMYGFCAPGVEIDVYDPDGVDTVCLSYKRANETSWLNRTMDLPEPYEGNRYYSSFRVNVSLMETRFDVQFFANDTLGHNSSSEVYVLIIRYSIPHDYSEEFPWVLIAQVLYFISIILIIYFLQRRNIRQSS